MALPGQANVTLVIGATDKASGVLRRIGGGITGFAKIASAAVAGAAAAFVGLGAISIKSAISVQSAFTGVAKTTDGLVDQFGELTEVGAEIKQGFRDLAKEVPIAVEELLGIGELAGQLGVPREAIVDFAEVVAALGVTTNLTTEEAATDLARLANIYQISADDMAENTKAIGSVIVDLGNNFATTERDILGFGQRIAAAGSIAGITQAEVLGIGAAMASVGVEADAGGTAVQKVLIAMVKSIAEGGESLDAFARATGKTVNEFKKDFEEDAGQVFEDFVLSLGAQGDKAILTLKELGLEDQRLVRAFLSLAGAGDLITRSMDTASEAFDTNEALGKEAQLRYGTMESQLLILKNTLRDVGVTIGDALLPFLVDAVELVKPFIEEFGEKLPQFIEEDLIPAFEKIGIFFSEDLPEIAAGVGEALTPVTEGLDGLVTAVLESELEWKAAWQDIMDFAEDDFAPAIQESLDNVGEALDNLTELWKENDEKTINILALTVESILATVGVLALSLSQLFLGMTQLIQGDWKGFWQSTKDTAESQMNLILAVADTDLEEFLSTWEGILKNVGIIVTEIFNATLSGFKEGFKLILAEVALFALDIIGAFNDLAQGVAQAIQENIIDKLTDFGDFLRGFRLPKWIVGDSPGTFELGIRGITDALNGFAKAQKTAFNPIAALPSGSASQTLQGGGDQIQREDHFNLTVNSRARSMDVIQSFEGMRALRGGAI